MARSQAGLEPRRSASPMRPTEPFTLSHALHGWRERPLLPREGRRRRAATRPGGPGRRPGAGGARTASVRASRRGCRAPTRRPLRPWCPSAGIRKSSRLLSILAAPVRSLRTRVTIGRRWCGPKDPARMIGVSGASSASASGISSTSPDLSGASTTGCNPCRGRCWTLRTVREMDVPPSGGKWYSTIRTRGEDRRISGCGRSAASPGDDGEPRANPGECEGPFMTCGGAPGYNECHCADPSITADSGYSNVRAQLQGRSAIPVGRKSGVTPASCRRAARRASPAS